jgi:hypothetical protein
VPGPRVSAQTHRCPKFGPRMGVSSPPDTFGSARWALFFRPLCPVGQKRTRGVRLGRPAGDALRSRPCVHALVLSVLRFQTISKELLVVRFRFPMDLFLCAVRLSCIGSSQFIVIQKKNNIS